MANSNIIPPDFAYPKTVSTNAEKDLKAAKKNHDAHAALNALIRYAVSQKLIDPDNAQNNIKLTQKTSEYFEESNLYPVFLCLLAEEYYGMYSSEQWKYNQRELPLTPLSEDITEWSGDQFKHEIEALYSIATNVENSEKLSQLQVKDYEDIIKADELTCKYYPTLLDFVTSQALSTFKELDITGTNRQLVENALSKTTDDSASWMVWKNALYGLNNINGRFETYKQAYSENKDNQYSGMLLDNAGDNLITLNDEKWFVEQVKEYNVRFPHSDFRNQLINRVNDITRVQITVKFPTEIPVNTSIALTVENKNATNYNINIYQLSKNIAFDDNNRNIKKIIDQKKPDKTYEIVSEKQLPFAEDTTINIRLDNPGVYVIVPEVKGKSQENAYYSVTRCLPVFPVAIDDKEYDDVIITEANSGAPINDAKIKIGLNKGKEKELGITDHKGISVIKKNDIKENGNLIIEYNGEKYAFKDMYLDAYRKYDQTQNVKIANILTDRALYHPGDEVNVLAVFSNSITDEKGATSSDLMADTDIALKLLDVNWQPVDTIYTKTDAYGRATGKFVLPTEGLTGRFVIQALCVDGNVRAGSRDIIVSDYRMPDFEVNISEVACDTPEKGEVTVTGQAISYSGVPMSNTSIALTLERASWWWFDNNKDKIYSIDTVTDTEGCFKVILPKDIFEGNENSRFCVMIDAVSPSGSTAKTDRMFALRERYSIALSLSNNCVDGENLLKPDVKVYAADGSQVEIPLVWSLSTLDGAVVASGDYYGTIDFATIKPATYNFSIAPKDKDIANTEESTITIYNRKSGIVPNDATLWVPTNKIEVKDVDTNIINVELATGGKNTSLYYYVEGNGTIKSLDLADLAYGYHTLQIALPDDCENASVNLFCVNNCNLHRQNIAITRPKNTKLVISGESFRDNLVPNSQETWTIKITMHDGQPVEAALALDMYNKALEALAPHMFGLNFYSNNWIRNVYVKTSSNYSNSNSFTAKIDLLKYQSIFAPEFNLYGYGFSYYGIQDYCLDAPRVMMSRKMNVPSMAEANVFYDMDDGIKEDAVDEDEISAVTGGSDEDNLSETDNFDYRDADVPMAVWAPALTTDASGNINYTFTVPNANTTWRLQAVAWSKDMEVGALMRDFVASKPVMVVPNVPRFLRAGDLATIQATVINNTDSIASIKTTVEIFDPISNTVISVKEFDNEIASKQNVTVTIDVTAPGDVGALGYRIRATNGQHSDGEQSVIKILPSLAQLIETTPFYLNPGEERFETTLPKADDVRISLTFCENPVWTIVTALPGLREEIDDYANSAAAALFSASIARGIINDNPEIAEALRIWKSNPSDSALISMLQKNEDLKQAVLNSTPWVQAAQSDTERMANLAMIFDSKEVDASIAKALKILSDLQRSDGGWAWGKWCDESSVWVTSNVLAMIGDLKACGWLDNDSKINAMVKKALKYYDSKVEDTDILYTLIRPRFKDVSISSNGQAVIRTTLKEIRKNWKKYSDPAYKSMAAMALYLNEEVDLARKLMTSVSEFGVYTPSQGLKFPSVNALYDYAIILEAFGLIEPDSKDVDGLRQQLIVRKQGTDWGSAVVTTEVVRSILTTGTRWTVPAHCAAIKVGDTEINPQGAIETSTGSLRADLTGHAGQQLTVTTTGVGPAYGAVYAQFSMTMDEVKASACDDLDIEKQMYVRRGTQWAVADSLTVGDRVKVQLTIHCKRNLQYVEIIDERPATFEPVEQLPGWMWSEGVGFYRENRDSSTNLHVIYMSPGTYLLTYEMNVNVAGTFSSGVATIQSQYAPEITAHSSGQKITIK